MSFSVNVQFIETNSENMKDAFSKDMFGTDEVTVTVEYDGPNDEQEENTLAVNENEERE